MKRAITILACLGSALASWAQPAVMRIELKPHQADVYADEALFTSYRFSDTQKYPFFYPVNGPASGQGLTTHATEPFPHHSSLFLSCDKVNGANFWQEGLERGRIASCGIEVLTPSGHEAVFTDLCFWRHPDDGSVLIEDRRTFALSAPMAGLRVLDATFELKAATDVHIERNNHSLFSARVATHISVNGGGTIVNAHGAQGESETFGKPSPWMDYSGDNHGVVEGLAILEHPDNPWYPAPWFTRDYGFMSPTPLQWQEGGLSLPKGEQLLLRYRVLVHRGDAHEAAVAAHHAHWLEQAQAR